MSLGGGWKLLNPCEKYGCSRQKLGSSFPSRDRGEHAKKYLSCHHLDVIWLVRNSMNKFTMEHDKTTISCSWIFVTISSTHCYDFWFGPKSREGKNTKTSPLLTTQKNHPKLTTHFPPLPYSLLGRRNSLEFPGATTEITGQSHFTVLIWSQLTFSNFPPVAENVCFRTRKHHPPFSIAKIQLTWIWVLKKKGPKLH